MSGRYSASVGMWAQERVHVTYSAGRSIRVEVSGPAERLGELQDIAEEMIQKALTPHGCGNTFGEATCTAPAGHSGLHEARLDEGLFVWGIAEEAER